MIKVVALIAVFIALVSCYDYGQTTARFVPMHRKPLVKMATPYDASINPISSPSDASINPISSPSDASINPISSPSDASPNPISGRGNYYGDAVLVSGEPFRFLDWIIHGYKDDKTNLLKITDPCIFNPCGSNTYCVRNKHNSKRTCHCTDNHVPHPHVPESCVRPCDVESCGDHSFCINENGNDLCLCEPDFFPRSNIGDEDSFAGCFNPCHERPCNSSMTICLAETAIKRQCLCMEGTNAIDGDAAAHGCATDPCISTPCQATNTLCFSTSATNRECMCVPGTIPVDNDATANGCTNDPCYDIDGACGENAFCYPDGIKAACECLPTYYDYGAGCVLQPCLVEGTCGQNAFCVLLPDKTSLCSCLPGFFPDSSALTAERGGPALLGDKDCIDPCAGSPCTKVNSACSPLSDTGFQCVCIGNTFPIKNDVKTYGCHRQCGLSPTATYILETDYCLEVFLGGDTQENWNDARTKCVELGGDLAVFSTQPDDFVALLLSYFPVLGETPVSNPWLGGFSSDNKYFWLDGNEIDQSSTIWEMVFNGAANSGYNDDENIDLRIPLSTSTSADILIGDRPEETLKGYICQYFI